MLSDFHFMRNISDLCIFISPMITKKEKERTAHIVKKIKYMCDDLTLRNMNNISIYLYYHTIRKRKVHIFDKKIK